MPGAHPVGVEVARLGKRIYRDQLALLEEATAGRRLYRIYGEVGYDSDETGTDLIAVAAGKIAVTPLHFDLTDHNGVRHWALHDLDRLVPSRPLHGRERQDAAQT